MRKMLLTVFVILMTVSFALTGCQETGKAEQAAATWQEIVPGLTYVDSTLGSGDVVGASDFVEVHYTGWLFEDGAKTTQFDSSVERGEPIAFPLGRSFVIPGWEKGLVGMKVGGKRTLKIENELAYGPNGRPPVIPPAATLMFDVEIVRHSQGRDPGPCQWFRAHGRTGRPGQCPLHGLAVGRWSQGQRI